MIDREVNNVVPFTQPDNGDELFDNWTRYDDALTDLLLKIEEKRVDPSFMIRAFNQYADHLSDSAFWYLLGMLWNRHPAMECNIFWLKNFGSKRPCRAIGMMKPEELGVLNHMREFEAVAGYRPQTKTGGLHPFIFCANMRTALRHATTFGADIIGSYSIPSQAVSAYFERFRGPEVLVLDCADVKLETITPVGMIT